MRFVALEFEMLKEIYIPNLQKSTVSVETGPAMQNGPITPYACMYASCVCIKVRNVHDLHANAR